MTDYASLELIAEIKGKDGSTGRDVIVRRPSARDLIAVNDEEKVADQLAQFVTRCCRLVNGNGKFAEFDSRDLQATDGAEFGSILVAMMREVDRHEPTLIGDGINEPIVYNLKYPVQLAVDGDTIKQIQFQAKKIGDISDFLDAKAGSGEEFYAFMRSFGELLGTRLPMSDSMIAAMDFEDYLNIRKYILPKLVNSRSKWKRVS